MPRFGKDVKGGNRIGDAVTSDEFNANIEFLKAHDKQAKLNDVQRQHLKKMQLSEVETSKINQIKVINNWRTFMRNAKLETLKRDIEVLAQDHEREVDRKDSILNLLLRNLEEADEQLQVSIRSHMTQVDNLISIHETRTTLLENEFETDLQSLRVEFESEIRQLQAHHLREKKELSNIISTVEGDEVSRESESKQENETEREDIRTKNNDDINMLRLTLEAVIDDLEKQFDEAHAQYQENTENNTKLFKNLTDQDEAYSSEIDTQLRQIDRWQALINFWRKKLAQNDREGKERNRLLKSEKEAVTKHYHELKDRMARSRDQQSKRLTELALWARDATATNQKSVDRAQNILKLAELSRKLETVNERVQPFLSDNLSQLDAVDVDPRDETMTLETSQLMDSDAKERFSKERMLPTEWEELNMFYRKYNRALLGKLAIDQEKKRLEKENLDLRSILKQYLDGVSITPTAVDGANSLLVVNGNVNLNQRPVRRIGTLPPNTTVVEAATVMKTYASHR